MSYSHEEIEKRIKYIGGKYYMEVTEEAKEIFGEEIVKRALVLLDIEGILRNYRRKKRMVEMRSFTRPAEPPANFGDFIVEEGVGNIFESALNTVLEKPGQIQIHASDYLEHLVITLINDKEVFIRNSEWGEVSMVPVF